MTCSNRNPDLPFFSTVLHPNNQNHTSSNGTPSLRFVQQCNCWTNNLLVKEYPMEKLLPENIAVQIREVFQQLKNPVQVLLFVSQENCDYCAETRQLLEEVIPLSGLLSLSVHDLAEEPDLAKLYQVEGKAPAMVIAAKEGEQVTDYGIRYLGIPSGHEFTTLIQDLILVSGRDSGLSPQLREYVKSLTKPLHLQVFVTPT
jgi:alkyl hydroperoxide reductase subunit AhpF